MDEEGLDEASVRGALQEIMPAKAEFIAAVGYLEDYEESVTAWWRLDGILYEYDGSHCSCVGFEGEAAKITRAYLLTILETKGAGASTTIKKWLSTHHVKADKPS